MRFHQPVGVLHHQPAVLPHNNNGNFNVQSTNNGNQELTTQRQQNLIPSTTNATTNTGVELYDYYNINNSIITQNNEDNLENITTTNITNFNNRYTNNINETATAIVPINKFQSHSNVNNITNENESRRIINENNCNIINRRGGVVGGRGGVGEHITDTFDGNENGFINGTSCISLHEDNLNKLISTVVYGGTNQTYNDNRQSFFERRENLTKLDLDTNHHSEGAGGKCGDNDSSIYSESSPDDSFLEDDEDDEEAHLPPTPPSSCESLHSPEDPNYTRGIINPNYPGFQQYAHTLSDHFNDHHFENSSSDSDVSEEFEIDLVVTNNIVDFDNNNNNNNDDDDDDNNIIIDDDDDELMGEENNVNLLLKIEPKIYCEKIVLANLNEINLENDEENNHADDEEEEVDDEIYEHVQLAVSQDDNTFIEMKMDKIITPTISVDINQSIDINNESSTKHIVDYDDEKKIENCDEVNVVSTSKSTTPDILIKNDNSITTLQNSPLSSSQSTSIKNEIGNNLGSQSVPLSNINTDENEEELGDVDKKLNPSNLLSTPKNDNYNYYDVGETITNTDKLLSPEHSSYTSTTKVQHSQQQISNNLVHNNDLSTLRRATPIDIVGDFGREIEREIGLIISGYNQITVGKVEENISHESNSMVEIDVEFNVVEENEAGRKLNVTENYFAAENSKMSDAQLSNAKEEIISLVSQNIIEVQAEKLDSSVVVVLKTSSPVICSTELSSITNKIVNDQQQQHTKTLSEQKKLLNLDLTTKHSVPTAIVKPKYQQSSYDDRQLPSSTWYNQCDQKHQIYKKSIQHLPHFERKATISSDSANKKSVKFINQKLSGTEKELINSKYGQSEKDIDCSKKSIGSNFNQKNLSLLNLTAKHSVAIVQPRKKDKMEINLSEKRLKNHNSYQNLNNNNNLSSNNQINNSSSNNKISLNNNNNFNGDLSGTNKTTALSNAATLNTSLFKKSIPGMDKDTKRNRNSKDILANFDVYNIETALPVIDLEAIENHLKAAKEEERRRRNDREEIRRRLAMGDEDDYFRNGGMPNSHEKPTRKPSLQSRLKNGMNLQICFMNDPVSDDNESPSSDSETCPKLSKVNTANYQKYTSSSSGGGTNPYNSRPLSVSLKQQQNKLANGNNSPNYHSNGATKKIPATRPMSLSLGPPIVAVDGEISSDFFTKQAKLQIEARMALSQAKDMAHMQMEIERQKQKQSPITEVIRNSLEKVGVHFPPEKRRVSRQMLTDMNIAQLQVIVNELHTQIEFLNEKLVQYLMERDELHMSQDSMLVDIEDLTRYLGAKEQPNIETAESRKNSTLSMSSSTSSTSINNKNHLKLTIPKSSSNHLKSSSSSSSDNSPQNLTKSSSQNSITSTSSHSQILQNRFLRIASLVKK